MKWFLIFFNSTCVIRSSKQKEDSTKFKPKDRTSYKRVRGEKYVVMRDDAQIGRIQRASREMKMENTVCGFFAVKNERPVGSINLIECSWIMGGTVKNNSAVKEQPGEHASPLCLPPPAPLSTNRDRIEPTRVIFIRWLLLLIRNRWNCG